MTFSESPTIPEIPGKSGWPWQLPTLEEHMSGEITVPKISIITPSYNQGHYLEETIRSIILQNYFNYELIIIDGGSTDSTLQVIKKYEPWITYWVSEKDKGQSHAIRKGLAIATGDIINWINSDDLLAPGALHAIASKFDLQRYDVICGYCDYFVSNLTHLDTRNERMGLSATVGDTILKRQINQPSTFFKTSIFRELDINEQFHYTMDLDLWYRYLLKYGQSRVLLFDKLLTYFRLHEASKTVALTPNFEKDIRKVIYNIFFSVNQASELMSYLRFLVNDDNFVPSLYTVNIPLNELRSLIKFYAWQAVVHYNQQATYDRAAARACLVIARHNGMPANIGYVLQWVKHYILPESVGIKK
ncbi:glycosyltransferase [Hymenobacter sp. BT507]|uniref:Glycosyltransferase n=1 Tax=Hymenobacter citatus TaxID=2763506 RepID=A0ABR7MKN9_9BACT|nr:glycosyltransferase family 2 protein [Hymenobacter citatus]MBC6611649.1 glycosyltransferase [Hymenobacter citatus]